MVGCGDSASVDSVVTPVRKAAEFKKDQGLLLTAEAAQFIGLRHDEITVKDGSLWVPDGAVVDTADGKSVFVRNGLRWLRAGVEMKSLKGEMVEITSGLVEGDVVVVAGGRYLWLAELEAIKGGVGCADGH